MKEMRRIDKWNDVLDVLRPSCSRAEVRRACKEVLFDFVAGAELGDDKTQPMGDGDSGSDLVVGGCVDEPTEIKEDEIVEERKAEGSLSLSLLLDVFVSDVVLSVCNSLVVLLFVLVLMLLVAAVVAPRH
jgi:hypothetical protein